MQEQVENTMQSGISVMKSGVKTRAFYVKHFSLADWELLSTLKTQYGLKSDADALRWAVRKLAGQI